MVHNRVAKQPHHYLLERLAWYKKWHGWRYHKLTHGAVVTVYTLCAVVFVFTLYRSWVLAGDLLDTWNFATPANYTLSSGVEASGTSVRLKAQNYDSDGNTSALFHLDESVGTNVSDSSSNSNNGTVGNSSSWIAGSLNNALSLNGAFTYVSAPDSASLSLSQSNTLEAWTKFGTAFGAGTHEHAQGVIDKGSYKLYYNQESGKVVYELADASATSWTQQAGSEIKNSWDVDGKFAVNAQVIIGGELYVGLGNAVGDAEVWKWDGSVWTQIGGDGLNSGWAASTFENVTSIAANGNVLYAGLGSGPGDGEVWSCDTSTDCTAWTKIGGDGLNSGWPVNVVEEVESMTVMGGNLYAGLGTTTTADARVYRWNGSAWTWVGGNGVPGPFNAFPTDYEGVFSMSNDGTNLYAGMGSDSGDGDVWQLTGNTWTQIGGDGTGWAASTYETVLSLHYLGSNLYAGLGTAGGDAEVWRYNGSTWTQIGGDTLNSSWDNSSFEGVYGFADDGSNIYAGLGSSAGDNEVWSWNGSSWSKIGGDGVNSGFTNTHTQVKSLAYSGSTLYAGLVAAAADGEVWGFTSGNWSQLGGGGVNKSWGFIDLQSVESMAMYGNHLYAGTSGAADGNALVWRFDGVSWELIGGQDVGGSWNADAYKSVMSMATMGGNLYVGLGTSSDDAEVWEFNGTVWAKVGGDGVNSGWGSGFEEVTSLIGLNGNLYAGLGSSDNDAEVWEYDGAAWTRIGGDSINSGWAAGFNQVRSMGAFRGALHAGLGSDTGEAEVWSWNGSSWSKAGGDGVNSSWNTDYEQVESLLAYNDKLYAGIGTSTADAELWEYNGSAWAKIGGDSLNSSWLDGQYEQVKSLAVYNGRIYAGLANGVGDGDVWELNGTAWTRVGGSGINNSWTANSIEDVNTLATYKGKLYAGIGNTANADAAVWSYGNNGYVESSTVGQNTSWHHLAATYDGATMSLYIDGVLDVATVVSLTLPDSPQALLLGSTLGGERGGISQGYFDGALDEIHISDIVRSTFNSRPYSSDPQTVTLNTPVRTGGVWFWDDFTDDETANGGSITYRLSYDGGDNWYFWDGGGWVLSTSTSEANSVTDVGTNIDSLPVTFEGVTWQAILDGDGNQRVTLNSVSLDSQSDAIDPATNASSIVARKAFGGSIIPSNGWTNGGSPYFTWTIGTDNESGIKGYCVYLGTDGTADPVTTKGLLGSSPIDVGDKCQFAVNAPSINLATPGFLASSLTTSSSPYFLRLKAIDNAGNVFDTAAQFQFRFDNVEPTNPVFVTSPSGFVSTKEVLMTWPTTGGNAPADDDSGVIGLQYRIGSSGTWYGDSHTGTGTISDILANDGSYTTQDPPDFDNLVEGINTVYFRTWDTAGNVTTTYVTAALRINTSGFPSEPLNLVATPTLNSVNAFSFTWDPPATFVGAEGALQYCYTVNTLPTVSNCTFGVPGETSLPIGPYATQLGLNTIYIVARDESGNVSFDSYASTTFTADTPAPGVPLNLNIVDVSIRDTGSWRLALTWDEPTFTGAGIASYRIQRSTDNVVFTQVGISTSPTYIDVGLSQIRYYYKVQACDNANNCGIFSSVVDELPTGQFTSPAILVAGPDVSNVTTKRATITWSTDRDSDSRIAIGTSSGSYSPSEIVSAAQVSAHEINLDNLSAGTTYYFVAKWTDEDGNTGVSQEGSFTTAPAPTIKEVEATNITPTSARIKFTSTNAAQVVVYYGLSESFGGVITVNTSESESTYEVNLNNLNDGAKYFYKLIAYDVEGGAYQSTVFSFNTPSKPKIFNLQFQPIEGEPTSTQRVTWQTNVPATSIVTYGKVGTDGNEISDAKLKTDHEIIIRNLEDASDYFLVASSRDADGNLAVSDRHIFRTALDTRPPTIRDVVVESSVRGSGAEARGQVVVSWRTDEPATSQVAYGEGSAGIEFNNRTAEDSGLAFEHIVIISDLPTSKVYSVQPISKDKSENTARGKVQSAIIGRASDSVLTIILETLKKIFGL